MTIRSCYQRSKDRHQCFLFLQLKALNLHLLKAFRMRKFFIQIYQHLRYFDKKFTRFELEILALEDLIVKS
jgi:hypothetical protein